VLLLVTGMPGSGKSVFASVAASLGFEVFSMGDVVREFAQRAGITEAAEVNVFADRERRDHGPDIWAIRTAERIAESGARRVVVDGVRSRFEAEVFERVLGERAVVVAIVAPRMERYRRILGRGRVDDPESIMELQSRDWREISWGVAELIALADYYIVNDEDLDSFMEKSKKKLREILEREAPAGAE